MPTRLVNLIVNLAINVGLHSLIKKFPGMPQEIILIIENLIEALKNATTKEERKELKKSAKACVGVACTTTLKKE